MAVDESNTIQDRSIAPNICVQGVEEAIQFYQRAFGAEILFRRAEPNGSIHHAKVRIGPSSLIVSRETPRGEARTGSPSTLGGTSASFELFVDDIDAAFDRALNAGGKALTTSTADAYAYFGDRVCVLTDPFGHIWTLSTFIDDGGMLCV